MHLAIGCQQRKATAESHRFSHTHGTGDHTHEGLSQPPPGSPQSVGEPTSWCMTVTANGRCVIAWTGSLLAPVHVGGVSRVCQPEYWGGGGGVPWKDFCPSFL